MLANLVVSGEPATHSQHFDGGERQKNRARTSERVCPPGWSGRPGPERPPSAGIAALPHQWGSIDEQFPATMAAAAPPEGEEEACAWEAYASDLREKTMMQKKTADNNNDKAEQKNCIDHF